MLQSYSSNRQVTFFYGLGDRLTKFGTFPENVVRLWIICEIIGPCGDNHLHVTILQLLSRDSGHAFWQ